MNNVLLSKKASKENLDKLIEGFDANDYLNRDATELLASLAIYSNGKEFLKDLVETLSRDSGITEINGKIASLDNIIGCIKETLASRADEESVGDKTLVKLTKDETAVVVDADYGDHTDAHLETQEVVDAQRIISYEIDYEVLSLDNHNRLAGTNISSEDFFYNFISKLVDLELCSCVIYAKKPLSDFDHDTMFNIINMNYAWHTFADSFKVHSSKLKSNLKLYPEKRDELCSLFYIKRCIAVKEEAAKTKQLSLFEEDNAEVVNLDIDEGGSTNE